MNPKKYWVYIVGSVSGTLYIGMTNNIDRRMAEHKSREFDGFALKYHCDRLVYYESFDDCSKSNRSREAIERLDSCEEDCPGYIDQPQMARFGGEMGSADGVCRRADEGPMRECLEAFFTELRGMGSFDCAVVRFRDRQLRSG